MRIRSRIVLAAWLLAAIALWASAGTAADPADFPALEWLDGDGAHERVIAIEGVVLVDLYADY